MTDFKVTNEGQICLVNAAGDLTIEHAAKLREALVTALSSGTDVEIDMSRVETVDISCLQLLCSACKSANKAGRTVTIEKSSRAFASRAASGGFVEMQCEVCDRCPVAGGGYD